jgi:hypothetical protein
MIDQKRVVLDANILLRAVFGVRVLALLETYEDFVWFFAPDLCFVDARKYIPSVSAKRRIDPAPGLAVLDHLSRLVEIVNRSLYEEHESSARERMISRDVVIGRSWLQHYFWDARSGPRTEISSGVASRHGLQRRLNFTCETPERPPCL